MSQEQQLFEQRASATLKRVASIFCQRGTEYSDTWKEAQFLKMKAVAKKLGAVIPNDAYRAIACAAFCDMKYSRLAGGYKEDSIDDGIAYDAFLADEVRSVEVERQLAHRKAESAAQTVDVTSSGVIGPCYRINCNGTIGNPVPAKDSMGNDVIKTACNICGSEAIAGVANA